MTAAPQSIGQLQTTFAQDYKTFMTQYLRECVSSPKEIAGRVGCILGYAAIGALNVSNMQASLQASFHPQIPVQHPVLYPVIGAVMGGLAYPLLISIELLLSCDIIRLYKQPVR